MAKAQLHSYCLQYVKARIDTAQAAITAAQFSANEEGKSSAGDKYETGRAMMQLEVEKNTSQLLQAKQLLQLLTQINTFHTSDMVQQGSLVNTSNGQYYIAIGAGLVTIADQPYYVISMQSPIGALLKGKQVGDSFTFNGKKISILSIA
jgi:transcription elongation GreA/GreB family factor